MDHRSVVLIQLLLVAVFVPAFSLDKCTQDQLTYEFTECDSAEGRWRVAVPKSPGSCEASEIPVRQSDCTFSCEPGEYVDVTSKTLECKKCPAGTYSVGGGVRFTDWSKLPTGFESRVADQHYTSENYGYDNEFSYHEATGANCSQTGWLPLGDSISSPGDECTSELSYAVTLQKDGHVSFDYHYTDDIYTVFRVYVRNDECRVSSLDKQDTYPPSSYDNEWLTSKISLKAGRNVIIWQATAISYGEHDKREPIYIKSIEIQGVSYTSECTPCEPGFYNDEEAQGICKMCQENTFSLPGAKQCLKCNEVMEYSARGSRNCTSRKPCTEQDYYSIRTACDSDHKTQVKYMWIEPRICREDADGAKQLPASGAKEDCPPCNPGMQVNETDNSDCVFCPANYFSDGTKKCEKCPVSTEAVYGYNLQWWNRIPKELFASCFSMSDRGCASKQGWQPRGNYLDSGINQAADVYLTLHVEVEGFGNPEGLAKPKPGQYGWVKFVFEMLCSGNCKFKFKETRYPKGTNTVATWTGANTKQKYVYIVTSRAKTRFTWTFQKKSVYDTKDSDSDLSYSNDMVKIYSININNTLDGGAERCRACPVSSNQDTGCISCPEGNYVDLELHQCFPCRKNTYLNTSNPYGKDACIPCGPGLVSDEGSTFCHSDCFFDSKKHGRRINLTDLNGAHSVASGPSFTSRGFRYYHLFNLSLCGHPYKLARCHSNISVSTGNVEYFNLTSPVCRMTVVPDKDVYTTQTISLGDQLLGIYEDSGDNTTNETSVFTEKGGLVTNISTFFLFKYQSSSPTSACSQGRSVWTTVLCDITAPGKGVLELPAHCPDGTCDGCRFEILFRTKFACPICSVADYSKVLSSCEDGNRTAYYLWTEPKLCRGGISLPPSETKECSIFEQTVGSAMKSFKIGIAVAAALVVLMICCLIGLWYKNRKLTYKYHRLVQNSSDRPGELPGVEKCGVDDDEEDEEEVHFKAGNDRGRKILKKIKDMAGGGGGRKKEKVTFDDDDDEYFESVHLDSAKQALSDDMR